MNDEQSAYEEAKAELMRTVLKTPMNPSQAAVSAYANGILQSARISALVELVIELADANSPPPSEERFEELQVHHLQELTNTLKTIAAEPKIAIARLN